MTADGLLEGGQGHVLVQWLRTVARGAGQTVPVARRDAWHHRRLGGEGGGTERHTWVLLQPTGKTETNWNKTFKMLVVVQHGESADASLKTFQLNGFLLCARLFGLLFTSS